MDAQGSLEIIPAKGFGFPWGRLLGQDGRLVAEVGRYSALNIFLGRGQRIRLADGTRWRVRSAPWHRYVCPRVVDGDRRRLATSAPGPGDYRVTCRERAFTLIPAEKRPGRARVWELIEFDESVARIRRNPYQAEIAEPVPLQAVVLSFALAAFGVMGEKDIAPTTTGWAAPTPPGG
jgi:hypothetical protein